MSTVYDLRPFIRSVGSILETHRIGPPGEYRRWNWPDAANKRELGLNPYGLADAANILYTIGDFPSDPVERASWIAVMRGLQDKETGLFLESTHHEFHTTAHCIAALELFDARPTHSLTAMSTIARSTQWMTAYLEALKWREQPWAASHRGAGFYAALTLAGEVSLEWKDAYFAWLWENADPITGMMRKDCVGPLANFTDSLFPHLAGTFHYLFNQESAHQPLRYPSALVDTCLELFRNRKYFFGNKVSFAEIDWVYCLNRTLRQSHHRVEEARAALEQFAAEYIPFLLSLDPNKNDDLNDLHMLFGALCCVAELQAALPGTIRTEKPLRLVLDRRPFI